ncbi:metallophosphoesterase [Ralstonia solanacearum]|uniref:metallophosphoesterase n=1 Tax=Ralstonia solanacearum TaxID=305 RepID=UPI00078D552B|nr:metallophosphoesterase [Ralstonia solanacearum]AMP39251.1 metallophosphoesterase [Ralstonia solanacearum]AXV88083.1 metallophosphoesterase [Ralstonia solanacearum]AXW07568.1 metallophosphoesterase [Ralstonia solanacearum]AXW25358.1 metallophosphoesterase [Ralstonia solanacearum]AXW82270.1 metallophosphoesterase [Ralstonia solanacearum]
MNLLVLSDLHLEFSLLDIDTTGIDIIVLAGDIHLGTRGIPWIEAQSKGLPVIYVPGNHEFYKGEHSRVLRDLRAACAATPNVHLLDMDKITIGNVEFLGSTLWTDFALYRGTERSVLSAESYAARGMSDFTGSIRFEARGVFRKLQPRDTIQMHIAARQWLSNELMCPTQRKRVVVTHHAPSRQSVAPQYQDDPLSPAYASRMESVVQLAHLWIHGHMHDSFNYTVGECRVVCNPRGYAPKGRSAENESFDPRFIVEI